MVPTPPSADALERKRQSVWHNGRRNRVIAQIAEALASGHPDALYCHGLGLDGVDHLAGLENPRVAVLVESPEHGSKLNQLLPGWTLLSGRAGRGDDEKAAGAGPGDALDDRPDRTILTMVHADRLDPLEVDVLIRADGNDGPLALRGFPPCRRAARGREVLLVDLGDDNDDLAKEATRRRLEDYSRRGWAVEAEDRWNRVQRPQAADDPTGKPRRRAGSKKRNTAKSKHP